MIYVISYEPGENNAKEELVVNSLGFEFDTYANVPKENAFLSSPYLFAMRYCRVQIPAEADLTFDIEPIYGENGTADYSFARRVTAVAPHYKAVFGSPLITRYGYLQYDEIDLDADAAAIIEELCPDLENVVFESEAEKRTNGKVRYSIITFTCDYNGVYSYGQLSVGFSGITYIEYVSVINGTASDAELQNYTDMLASFQT